MHTKTRVLAKLRRLLLLQTGLIALTGVSIARGQSAPAPADASEPARKTVPIETKGAAPAEGDALMLSPFEVTNSENKGYFAANTMSGTRFNTKVEDLAASLTVVTKEQMSDFAMLDINDVFLYTAGTEGSGTFTSYSVDRNGSVSDNVQLNPTQANRVRGIAPANVSFGNYETQGRVPLDPSVLDGVEVSRGPNANVFGLGNASGTVNQVPATANVSRDKSVTSFRADTYDGYRADLDLNRVLIKDKLAIRGSGVFQHDGFVRKPSGVNTERYNGMIKYKPFKSTTISAAYYWYRMNGNRPNYSNPRDSVSYWLASGKPTWDPVAQVVHVNGTTLGPYPTNTTVAGGVPFPDYFNNSFTGSTHSYLYIDQSGVGYWTTPNSTVTLSSTGTLTNSGTLRLMSPSPAAGTNLGKFTAQPLFTTTPSVNDKSIYDWSKINLASINRDLDSTGTANVQLDQIIINTPMQTLAAQAGWLREDSQRYQRNIIGISNDNGQSGQLLVDVNERNLDGSPNPYLGRTYIGQDQPRTEYDPAKWDTYRGQLAYRLDLTQQKGWMKWLGMHQATGYNEYKYRINRRYSYRDAIADDNHTWLPAGVPRGNQGAITGGPPVAPLLTREYLRYYVGDANGTNVDYAPTEFKYGTYNFMYGNPTSGFKVDPTSLGQVAVTDATGGSNNNLTVLKTNGGVLQSHFINDMVVTTFGLRQDRQYVKAGATPQQLLPDGKSFDFAAINSWNPTWKVSSGKTKQGGVVVRPFRDISFLRTADNNGGVGGFLANALRGLAFTYNKSDSFLPLPPAVDLYGKALPNTTGKGKDYGFWMNLANDKIVIRFNHYDTRQLASRGTDASTIAQRVTRMDVSSTAAFLLVPNATRWVTQANPSFTTAQVQAEVARQIGLSTERQAFLLDAFTAGTLGSTQDIKAVGNELEINFNPTKFWTVSANATEQKVVNSNVSPEVDQYINERLPFWMSVVDQSDGQLWWTKNYGGSQTAAQNYATFIQTPFNVVKQLDGKSQPQIRQYNARVSTSLGLGQFTDNKIVRGFTVGGAVRWEDKGAIGYYGKQSLPAIITDLDASRPIYDKGHYYFDAFVKYRTKLFADRVGATIQANVRNIQESGRLQAIGAYPDGTPNAYRIVDPRQFIFQVTFDM